MNQTTIHDNDTAECAGASRRSHRPRMRRLAGVVACVALAASLSVFGQSSEADAATGGWDWYPKDLDGDGRYNDMYVYRDSSGWYLGWWVFLDTFHGGVWDAAAIDTNRDGSFDQVWFDINRDGGWDTAVNPNSTFFCIGLNQRDANNAMYEGFGQFWAHCSWTQTVVTVPVRDPIQRLILLLAKITDSVAY